MATTAAPPKPRPQQSAKSPLIRGNVLDDNRERSRFIIYLVAAILSCLFNAGIVVALFFLQGLTSGESANKKEFQVSPSSTEAVVEQKQDVEEPTIVNALDLEDIDPNLTNPTQALNYANDNIKDFSVPGLVNPDEPIGILGGDVTQPPRDIPPPPGLGFQGQGGLTGFDPNGFAQIGEAGGYGIKADSVLVPGGFGGRSGSTKQKVLVDGGGGSETEAAVARGIQWLMRVQLPDGSWRLDGPFSEAADDGGEIAATAFGLLPFLAAGHTHRATSHPFDKPIEKALLFLIRRQDPKTGNFGGNLYHHSLATIAMCEAYGLTQDPSLRVSAQKAVNYLIASQHSEGGWRYGPNQAGDTSVAGWSVMALKSAKMAGLSVPEITFRKAIMFVNSVHDPNNDGYGYTGPGSSPTMSAVGLLCRQYLQNWGPAKLEMIRGVKNHLERMPPAKGRKHIYYYYYATQVMHHFGGEAWKKWNDAMKTELMATQQKTGADAGSWSPSGDPHAKAGGRLMYTSLSLLTLEVYYRYLPLYYRQEGERQQKLLTLD